MAAVTIPGDLKLKKKIKSDTVSTVFPSISHITSGLRETMKQSLGIGVYVDTVQ